MFGKDSFIWRWNLNLKNFIEKKFINSFHYEILWWIIKHINSLLFNKILNQKNLSNIKFSGLKGQALAIEDKDIPSIKEFQDVIPDHYFKCNTKTSFRYLLQSALIQSLVVAIGLSLSLIHIWRCRRSYLCRSRWSPYH